MSEAIDDVMTVPNALLSVLRRTELVGPSLRSANLERDSGTENLDAIFVGSRASDVLTRLAAAMEDPERTRAWSLTGPYGSGKSTIALLISALLGPPCELRTHADELMRTEVPEIADRLIRARTDMGTGGFLVATATARPEPLRETIFRALIRGTNRYWPNGKPTRRAAAALRNLRISNAGAAEMLETLQTLGKEAPVLLVIDEFGKSLEHVAKNRLGESPADDVYILQEIAELSAGKSGVPLFALTLQHQSFLDYAATSSVFQRREWAKIQGRFEEISFTPDIADSVGLLKRYISHASDSDRVRKVLQTYVEAMAEKWSNLGLESVLPADCDTFSALLPLHPLTAAAAPLIAAQVGQNERSLSGFMTGDEPHTVRRFLDEQRVEHNGKLPIVGLGQVYDYFLTSGRNTILASANAGRWIEIDAILSQAHGLPPRDVEVLKTVGVLNLIDSSGALRASSSVVSFALCLDGEPDGGADLHEVLSRLESLVARGFLVYREFSDEYRIWRGTDIDIPSRLSALREHWSDSAIVRSLSGRLPLAIVGGRHSQQTGMLRNFRVMATDGTTDSIKGPTQRDSADGILLFHFGSEQDLPRPQSPVPVVAGISANAQAVLDAGREVLALNELLAAEDLDSVARREVSERLGQAQIELSGALGTAFNPMSSDTHWLMINGVYSNELGRVVSQESPSVLEARSLSGIVSAACDSAYPKSPHIRNEMLARHQLTSQGAKARRELISAMINNSSSKRLGIIGYGPERAIYDGVVSFLGLHVEDPGGGGRTAPEAESYVLAEPPSDSSASSAWSALKTALVSARTERPIISLFDILMAPPFGVKAGVVPVLVIAALAIFRDEIAVFEEGSYQTHLTAELAERLVKAPERYTFKYVPTNSGQRRLVLDLIMEGKQSSSEIRSTTGGRNGALLGITRDLLTMVRGLSAYAMRTQRLSVEALDVRRALMTARDPDDLVFNALPDAVGLGPIPVDGSIDETQARTFVGRLAGAIQELTTADAILVSEVWKILSRELALPETVSDLREELAARVSGLEDIVHEPELRGFVQLAGNLSLSDEEWLDPVAVRIVRAGIANWGDAHIRQFEEGVRRLSKALDRVVYLHNTRAAHSKTDSVVSLLTLTQADGQEKYAFVRMREDLRVVAVKFAEKVAGDADQLLGRDGRRMLLASLAELMLDPANTVSCSNAEMLPKREE